MRSFRCCIAQKRWRSLSIIIFHNQMIVIVGEIWSQQSFSTLRKTEHFLGKFRVIEVLRPVRKNWQNPISFLDL